MKRVANTGVVRILRRVGQLQRTGRGQGSAGSVHGEEMIANELSGYYLAGHLGRTYEGMMIAVPEGEWHIFQSMSTGTFAHTLQQLANKVNLVKFKKHK